ncbi:MAG TPA: hypothetical protein VIV14_13095 [Gammaproteobacteria bacterium]
MNIQKTLLGSAFLACITLLFGCSATPVTDDEFGDSVRQMVRSQKIFVAVDEAPVSSGDGQRLEAVLESYRSNEPAAVTEAPASILINSGN